MTARLSGGEVRVGSVVDDCSNAYHAQKHKLSDPINISVFGRHAIVFHAHNISELV